jgi:CBS domain containing-hemolysin-like protein
MLQIALVLFFVLLNAFFVAAEFAIVKVRSTQIEPLLAKKNLRAQIAKEIIDHLDSYLSASQLGITMASLALGWVGEPFVASTLRQPLRDVGVQNPDLVQAIAFAIAFSIITLLHIVLGEQTPKWYAIQRSRTTTLFVAYPLKIFFVIFRPFIWVLNTLANTVVGWMGITMAGESELMHSQEELRLMLSQDKSASATSRNLVLNAMDFRRKQARHAMVPRREMVALSLNESLRDNLEKIRNNKFSRFPVYKESVDNIIGIVHTKDIYKQEKQLQPGFTIESVVRDATVLPETASIEKTLEAMLQRKTHMIILADEYGGTAGLITLEDILEELVGTIEDEFDREAPEITKITEREYLVDANVTTNRVEQLLNQELSPKDILSIGAFIIEQLGHIPKKGEVLRVSGAEMIVEEVGDKVIEKVRVKKVDATPATE